MSALRSLAVFVALYVAIAFGGIALHKIPGATALSFLLAGFLAGFPVDRVYAFWLWASESLRRVKTYRTCVVSTPKLQREDPAWHFVGHIRRHR